MRSFLIHLYKELHVRTQAQGPQPFQAEVEEILRYLGRVGHAFLHGDSDQFWPEYTTVCPAFMAEVGINHILTPVRESPVCPVIGDGESNFHDASRILNVVRISALDYEVALEEPCLGNIPGQGGWQVNGCEKGGGEVELVHPHHAEASQG